MRSNTKKKKGNNKAQWRNQYNWKQKREKSWNQKLVFWDEQQTWQTSSQIDEGKKTQIVNVRNERSDTTADSTDFKRIKGNVINNFMSINLQLRRNRHILNKLWPCFCRLFILFWLLNIGVLKSPIFDNLFSVYLIFNAILVILYP